jgi:hypothetical protein
MIRETAPVRLAARPARQTITDRTPADFAEALPGETAHAEQAEDQAWIDLKCAGRLPLWGNGP